MTRESGQDQAALASLASLYKNLRGDARHEHAKPPASEEPILSMQEAVKYLFHVGYDVSQPMIRNYENVGLIRLARTPGRQRKLSDSDIRDIVKIQNLLSLGLTLQECRIFWPLINDPEKTIFMLDEHTGESILNELLDGPAWPAMFKVVRRLGMMVSIGLGDMLIFVRMLRMFPLSKHHAERDRVLKMFHMIYERAAESVEALARVEGKGGSFCQHATPDELSRLFRKALEEARIVGEMEPVSGDQERARGAGLDGTHRAVETTR